MKYLLWDLETTPIKGSAWKVWEANLFNIQEDWRIACFSYKWLGDKDVKFVKPRKRTKKETEALRKKLKWYEYTIEEEWDFEPMIQKLWDLFNESDILIAHNLKRFDLKKSNAMFLRSGMKPPSPSKAIDTLAVARSKFALTSNKLDSIGEALGLGRKVPHEGFMTLIKGCLLDNKREWWAKMKEYNDQDVNLLEKVYIELRPWVRNHPNDLDCPDGCIACQGHNVVKKGTRDTTTYRYQRYVCLDCGAWLRGNTRIPLVKPKYKNA